MSFMGNYFEKSNEAENDGVQFLEQMCLEVKELKEYEDDKPILDKYLRSVFC